MTSGITAAGPASFPGWTRAAWVMLREVLLYALLWAVLCAALWAVLALLWGDRPAAVPDPLAGGDAAGSGETVALRPAAGGVTACMPVFEAVRRPGGVGGGRRVPAGGVEGDAADGGDELRLLGPARAPSGMAPEDAPEAGGGADGAAGLGGGAGGADLLVDPGSVIVGAPGGFVTAGPRPGGAGMGGGTTISVRVPAPGEGEGVVDAAPMMVVAGLPFFPGSGGGAPVGEGSGGGMLSQPLSISIDSAL